MKKLAIISTHPIQYNAPWFRLLSERGKVKPKVFYTWEQAKKGSLFDPGFGKKIEWDIPLLEGYEYTFVKNIAKDPGSHHYYGIVNPGLIEEVQEWRPDAILIFTWSHHSHLKCLRFFNKKIPVLFRGDSTLLDENKGLRKLLRRVFLTWLYKKVDFSLYVGVNNKNYYLRHGMREDQLVFAPHAIDNSRFCEESLNHSTQALMWRQELNIKDDDIVFLFAGKLDPVKQPELLIRAFLEIRQEAIHLVIVGNGNEEGRLKTLFSSVANLHFIGFQNQSRMPVVYNLADIFVLPSKTETWGLAINEAMACKKTVLASDKCGAVADLVENGVNGYTFISGNVDDLEEKMRRLVKSRDELQIMGNASFKKIQEYSFENICTGVEKLLLSEV